MCMCTGKQSVRLSAADRGRGYAAAQRKSIVPFIALCSAKTLPNPTPPRVRARERGIFNYFPPVFWLHTPIMCPGGYMYASKRIKPHTCRCLACMGSYYAFVSGVLPLSGAFFADLLVFLLLAFSALTCSRCV